MTNQIKLHVGYVGKTRDGKRVEIVPSRVMTTSYKGSNGFYYRDDGACLHVGPQEIIGPWVDEPAHDYNDGKWHGWNGGKCPVHPKTVVEYCWKQGTNTVDAGRLSWNMRINGLYAFRVVTPYVEPPKPREFWLKLTNTGQGIPAIYDHFAGGAIHVREVLDT